LAFVIKIINKSSEAQAIKHQTNVIYLWRIRRIFIDLNCISDLNSAVQVNLYTCTNITHIYLTRPVIRLCFEHVLLTTHTNHPKMYLQNVIMYWKINADDSWCRRLPAVYVTTATIPHNIVITIIEC